MLFIGRRINLRLYLRFHDVENGQPKGHTCQWSCPTRIAVDHGLGIKFRAVGVWGTENDDQIVFPVLVHGLLDTLLTVQVKGTSCRSHKALGLSQHGFSTCAFDTGFDGWALHPVSLSDDYGLFSFEFHSYPPYYLPES